MTYVPSSAIAMACRVAARTRAGRLSPSIEAESSSITSATFTGPVIPLGRKQGSHCRSLQATAGKDAANAKPATVATAYFGQGRHVLRAGGPAANRQRGVLVSFI